MTNDLDLPARVPLPPETRRRALDVVLAGIEEPARPRRRVPVALVAAAAVVGLVVGISVALARPGAPAQLAAAPAPVDLRSAEGMLARCAGAARGLPGYPAPPDWVVTATVSLGSDTVIVVQDAFACLLTPVSVALSPTRGTPIGDASVVRLAPAVLAVLNPQRRAVVVDNVATSYTAPDDAVQVLPQPGPDFPVPFVTVEGSYAGPLPEPAPPAVEVEERVRALREAIEPTASPVEPSGEEADLQSCLSSVPPWQDSRPELWTSVFRLDGDPDPVLLARIGDRFVGVCLLRPDGPLFLAAPMPAVAGTVAEADEPVTDIALIPLPNQDGWTPVWPPPTADPATCSLAQGIELCGATAEGGFTVRLLTSSEDVRIAPAPGR